MAGRVWRLILINLFRIYSHIFSHLLLLLLLFRIYTDGMNLDDMDQTGYGCFSANLIWGSRYFMNPRTFSSEKGRPTT